MPFEFKKCEIEGLYEIQPKVFGDNRGYLFENFNKRDFIAIEKELNFVQENQSFSKKNTIRGLHYQKKYSQGKIVRVISGKIYDVVVDLRNESLTFGQYYGIILDSEKNNQLYVPKGFAHGYLTLSDESITVYKFTDFYHPEDEGGLMWNDSAIGIDWESVLPGISNNANLSEKDKKHPAFNPNGQYFDINGKWESPADCADSRR